MTHPYYIMDALGWNPGFFCSYQAVVGFLHMIENEGNSGYQVFFEKGLYFDPKVGPNWWEYYFEPIYSGPPTEGITIDHPGDMLKSKWNTDAISNITRESAAYFIKKYIKVKPNLQQKIDDFIKLKFGQHTIATHYRGCDKSSEAPRVHYSVISDEVKKHIKYDSKIFVASDEQAFIQYMVNCFGNKVIYTDAIRSPNHDPIHHHDGHAMSNPYKLGEDAVIDCYLLSRSNTLIRTFSNLSSSAANINPDLKVIDLNQATYRKGLR
jgi:hypothetical protein